MRKITLFFSLLLITATTAMAAIENGKKYRIRSASTPSLYIGIADYNKALGNGRDSEGALQFKLIDESDTQIFMFELADGDNKYYIKNTHDGINYYIYINQWNLFAQAESTANKTPFTISEQENGSGVYTIYSPEGTDGGGYTGNTNAVSNGTSIYNNQQSGLNITWTFEEYIPVNVVNLKDIIASATTFKENFNNIVGDGINYYSSNLDVNEIESSIATAQAVVDDYINKTDDEINSAATTLQSSLDSWKAGLKLNMPEEGKYYRLKHIYANKYLTVKSLSDGSNNGALVITSDVIDNNLKQIFTFETTGTDNRYYLKTADNNYLSTNHWNFVIGPNKPTTAYNNVAADCGYTLQGTLDKTGILLYQDHGFYNNNQWSGYISTDANANLANDPINIFGDKVDHGDNNKNNSLWFFEEVEISIVELTYNYKIAGETKLSTTVVGTIGEAYPEPTGLPYGVTATRPEGVVSLNNLSIDIDCTTNLPFEFAASYGEITNWYYTTVHSNDKLFMKYTAGETSIPLTEQALPSDNFDNYKWAFVGNPFDGFKIVNKAAGENMILSSSTTMAGTEGDETYPILTDISSIPTSNNTLWVATEGYVANGVYFAQKGYPNNRMNKRNGKLAYWTGSADAGSTFMFTTAKNELEKLLETIVIGDGVCEYHFTDDEHRNAYNAIKEFSDKAVANVTPDAEIIEQINALNELIQYAIINLPEDGKVYRIKNIIANATTDAKKYHYIANNTATYTAIDNADNTTLWVCQQSADNNRRTFVSVVGDKSLAYLSIGANACNFEIGEGVLKGTTYLKDPEISGSQYMGFTNEDYNGATGINSSAKGSNKSNSASTWSTDFIFEEVNDYSGFATTIAEGSNGNYGTINLPFAVTLPEGVTAHGVTLSDDGTYLKTTDLSLTNNILPANTPALLIGEESGSKNFAPAPSNGLTAISTGLAGTLAATAVTNENAYILAYEGGTGSEIKFFQLDGTDNTVNANKAYYVETSGASLSTSLHIDLPGTTGIDSVEAENEAENIVYDLTGRRVEAATAPGIYIVNGKKVLVK